MRKFSFFTTMIVLLVLASNSVFAKIIMGPYLQAVTEKSIYVIVETDSQTPVNAVFGEKGSSLTQKAKTEFTVETEKSKDKTYMHRIKLDGLKHSTEYSYFIFKDKDTSKIYSFRTAMPPGSSFRFAIFGDNRSNPKVFSQVAKKVAKHNPYFSVYTGDVCYNSEYDSWKSEFFIEEHLKLIASVPFFNAIGNHEKWKQNTQAFQQAPDSKSNHQAYYSFDYGDYHFLIVSTEHGLGINSHQGKFMSQTLSSTQRKFKIVAFHIPPYAAGGHKENKNMKSVTTNIFEPNKVDITFAGHSHFYQHNKVNGITHLIVAGAGAPLYRPTTADYVVKSVREHHYAIADASPDKLLITVYNLKDEVIDKIEIKK